jgi:hypothetical protein
MSEIKEMEISFNPEWFKSGYYIYVLTVVHKTKGTYYYIGQTGDRKHIAARSPFYRLTGHFSSYNLKSGTDNQLVKGLINNFLVETPSENKKARICIEEAIENKSVTITANYYAISDFDKSDHLEKRKFVEEIELALLYNFRNAEAKIFNDCNKIGDRKEVINQNAKNIADEIFKKKR